MITLYKRLWIGCLAFMLAGCLELDFEGLEDPPVESQTEILEIRINPNPVAAGDTTVFTCVIEDSLDTRFGFSWVVKDVGTVLTDGNQLEWVAPDVPGRYSHGARVFGGDPDKEPPNRSFTVTVIEQD